MQFPTGKCTFRKKSPFPDRENHFLKQQNAFPSRDTHSRKQKPPFPLQERGDRRLQHAVVGQQFLHKLAESALPAADTRDIVHLALHIVRCIGGRRAEAHLAEQGQVVEVVADEGRLIETYTQLSAQRLGLRHLVLHAQVAVRNPQFLGSPPDNRRVFARQDGHGDAQPAQEADTPAVFHAEALHRVALGRVIHAAVRPDAVDVSHH